MVTSLDGRVTGSFLSRPECSEAIETYYEMHREYRYQGYGGFICGRVTMEESFTGKYYPYLSRYEEADVDLSSAGFFDNGAGKYDFYAIAFDPKGRLGWSSEKISDQDPGYDGCGIIEVITSLADKRYISYLKEMKIPYVVAGNSDIDVIGAMELIAEYTGKDRFLLEGGSIVNGSFLRAGGVDELSLVTAPLVASHDSKPLFNDAETVPFALASANQREGCCVSKYVFERKYGK